MSTLKVAAVAMALALTGSAHANTPLREEGAGAGMEPVAEVSYDDGMHLIVTRSGGRDYLISSAAHTSTPERPELRFFDITSPGKPRLVASLPCGGNQAFMQISHDGDTLLVGEGVAHTPDACMPAGTRGFYTIDISNPRKPRPLGHAEVERAGGGHTLTTHPTKPIVYISYGEPASTEAAEFEIWSIANPAKPRFLSIAAVTGYHGPHDIAFNADGTKAVAASMTLLQVLDTTNPAKPKEIEVLQCPGCSHNHEAHFTRDQEHVVVSDETSGGAASPCPLGGLYFYKWHPKGDPYMELTGEWQPAEVVTPQGAPANAGLCTSHVFDISRDGTKVAASWHNGGVRVIDITDMNGVGVGPHGDGPREIGWYVTDGADAWSAKFDRSGRFVYVNDRFAGLQTYRLSE